MGQIIKNGITYSGGGTGGSAVDIVYDNTQSEIQAENVQDAIDEVVTTTLNNLSFWTGTQAQYDAITDKNPTTLYFIVSQVQV